MLRFHKIVRRYPMSWGDVSTLVLLCCFLLGCRGSKSGNIQKVDGGGRVANVDGLAALPSDVQMVIFAELESLRRSPTVVRAFTRLSAREPGLRNRVRELLDACRLEPGKQLGRVIIGIRAVNKVVMVVSGKLEEGALVRCVSQVAGRAGGSLEVQEFSGRSIYHVQGMREVWFTMGSAHTLILSSDRDSLHKALDPKDILADAEFRALVGQAGGALSRGGYPNLWIAGFIPEAWAKQLPALGVAQGWARMGFVSLKLDGGLDARMSLSMNNEEDAKLLLSFVEKHLRGAVLWVQQWGIGPFVATVRLKRKGTVLQANWVLSPAQVKEMLSRIDTVTTPKQDKRAK